MGTLGSTFGLRARSRIESSTRRRSRVASIAPMPVRLMSSTTTSGHFFFTT